MSGCSFRWMRLPLCVCVRVCDPSSERAVVTICEQSFCLQWHEVSSFFFCCLLTSLWLTLSATLSTTNAECVQRPNHLQPNYLETLNDLMVTTYRWTEFFITFRRTLTLPIISVVYEQSPAHSLSIRLSRFFSLSSTSFRHSMWPRWFLPIFIFIWCRGRRKISFRNKNHDNCKTKANEKICSKAKEMRWEQRMKKMEKHRQVDDRSYQ